MMQKRKRTKEGFVSLIGPARRGHLTVGETNLHCVSTENVARRIKKKLKNPLKNEVSATSFIDFFFDFTSKRYCAKTA